jgi:predicted outer membrane repeat protein
VLQVTNSLFRGNNAFVGGAISSTQAIMLIANCTMVGNSAVPGGGAAISDMSTYSWMYNSILWNNGTENGADPLYVSSSTDSTVQYCNIMGGWPGNLNEPPSFEDEANHDYRLAADSPCIDAGDISIVPAQGQEYDLDFLTRQIGDAIDLGAYEMQDDFQDPCASDVTSDGQVNVMTWSR